MARVPTYDNLQTSISSVPNVKAQPVLSPEMATMGARQIQETGKALSQAGQQFGKIEADKLQEANNLRVADAKNRAKELEYKLKYDQEVGYNNITGVNALNRESGKPLADEYTERYKKGISEIVDSLGNDAQKRDFQLYAEASAVDFYGGVTAHEGTQYREYALSVREGTIKNAMNDIVINYDNPNLINRNIEDIKASAYDAARMNGKSATWAEAHTRELTSKAHLTAITAALQNENLKYASDYLKEYSKDMTAEDILQVNAKLTPELKMQGALTTARTVMSTAVPKIETSASDRAFNIAVQTESGGNQFDKEGKPLTSKAGAIGVAQVMPEMAPKAAKLAGVEWDEELYKTDAIYNYQLGKAMFEAELKTFNGSLPQAYAAYNAGAPRVQDALKKAEKEGGNWLSYLPTETQNYVKKNMQEFEKGGGKFERPSLMSLKDQVREKMPDADPATLKIALDEVESQYTDMTKHLDQKDEQAVATAMQAILDNGGKYSDLPFEIRSSVPANKVDKIMDFAAKIGKGEDVHTDWSMYYELKNDPALLMNTNLIAVRDKLSDTEFKELVRDQQEAQTDPDKLTQVRTVNQTLDQYMDETLGYHSAGSGNKVDKDKAAVIGRIQNAFAQRVHLREKNLKRKLSPEELDQEAARMFSSKVTVDAGVFSFEAQMPAAAVDPNSGDVIVPDSDRQKIIASLKKHNRPVTEQEISRTYLKYKASQ